MPTVAVVEGVKIIFYHNDHPPAHFHAEYGDHHAVFEIETLHLVRGFLPASKRRIVQEWAIPRRNALRVAFLQATARQRIGPIE